MKKIQLLFLTFLIPIVSFAQEKGLDQRIDEAFAPISNFFSKTVFFEIAGYPFVILLLIGSAAFFTVYFGFPNLRYFSTAINVVRGKYDDVEKVDNEDVNVLKIHPQNETDTIELLESVSDVSEIKKFLEKKGEGLHHIAFEVDDIHNAITYLKEKDIKIICDIPKKGSDNKLITFIHPKSTPGILIELCQSI